MQATASMSDHIYQLRAHMQQKTSQVFLLPADCFLPLHSNFSKLSEFLLHLRHQKV